MAYAEKADIEKQVSSTTLAQLTDDTAGKTTDSKKISQAIENADETINSYLQSRYAVPLSEVPKFIKSLSVDIAIFNLYSRRPEGEMPETVSIRYKNAIKFLESISAGKLSAGGIMGKKLLEAQRYETNKAKEHRIFSF